MSTPHLDLPRLFGGPRPRGLDARQLEHLDACGPCRRGYQLRSQALRLLGGDTDLPVGAEADAILAGALAQALPQQRRARWPWFVALASGGALVAALFVLRPVATTQDPAGFVERSAPLADEVGLRVFCAADGSAQRIKPAQACAQGATLVVTAHLDAAHAARAFLFFADAAGDIHPAHYAREQEAAQGVPVGREARDNVLDAWIDLNTVATGSGNLHVVLCRDCALGDALSAVQRERAKQGGSPVAPASKTDVYVESVIVHVAPGVP